MEKTHTGAFSVEMGNRIPLIKKGCAEEGSKEVGGSGNKEEKEGKQLGSQRNKVEIQSSPHCCNS